MTATVLERVAQALEAQDELAGAYPGLVGR